MGMQATLPTRKFQIGDRITNDKITGTVIKLTPKSYVIRIEWLIFDGKKVDYSTSSSSGKIRFEAAETSWKEAK
jgi:small-conductance mechanosensitive channel